MSQQAIKAIKRLLMCAWFGYIFAVHLFANDQFVLPPTQQLTQLKVQKQHSSESERKMHRRINQNNTNMTQP